MPKDQSSLTDFGGGHEQLLNWSNTELGMNALRINVAVAGAALAVGEEALGNHQAKLVFGSRHGDVEQATFLLDFRRSAGGKIGRQAPIDRVEQEN
jgi:hypothetical protein